MEQNRLSSTYARLPQYLRNIIWNYLRQVDSVQNSQRLFIRQEGEQGVLRVLFLRESVLGSILRNLDFNQVFEAAIPLDVKNLLCRWNPHNCRGKEGDLYPKADGNNNGRRYSECPGPGTKSCCPENRCSLVSLISPYVTPTNHMADSAIRKYHGQGPKLLGCNAR